MAKFDLEFHAQHDGTIVCARYDETTSAFKDQFTYPQGSSLFCPNWRRHFSEEIQLKMTRAIALSLVLQKEGHD